MKEQITTAFKVFKLVNGNLYSCCGYGKPKSTTPNKYLHWKKWFSSTTLSPRKNFTTQGWFCCISLADAIEYKEYCAQRMLTHTFVIHKVTCKGNQYTGWETDTGKELPVVVSEYIKILERIS